MFELWKYKRGKRQYKSSIREEVEAARGTPLEGLSHQGYRSSLRSGTTSVDRYGGAFGLGEFGDPGDVEILIQALMDESEEVRQEAATALGKIGDMRAIPALEELKDRSQSILDVEVRLAATKAQTRILKAERKRIETLVE